MRVKNAAKYFTYIICSVILFFYPLNAQTSKSVINNYEVLTPFNNYYCTDGFVLDTGIVYVPAENMQEHSAIAFDGNNYLVVWVDQRMEFQNSICGARLDQNGDLIDSASIIISDRYTWKWFPSVCFNGVNFLVAWDEFPDDTKRDIYGARVTPDGVVLDPESFIISNANNWQCDPDITTDGTNFFVTWTDERNGNDDIYGTRITMDGVVLDPNGIAISVANGFQGGVEVVFDGLNYFCVWLDERDYSSNMRDIYGARIQPDGTVIDTLGIAISKETDDEVCPNVTTNNDNYFVVWLDNRNGLYDVYCCRIDQSGIVIDTPAIYVNTTNSVQLWYIAVGCDGSDFLATWHVQDHIGYLDLYSARISADGTVLDTNPIPTSTAPYFQYDPTISFGNSDYSVVWTDLRMPWNGNIYGSRIDTSGTVLDPEGILISSSAYNQKNSSATFGSSNYLTVWQDTRNIDDDIYGMRIDTTGVVLDPACIKISSRTSRQLNPAAAFDGVNYFVVWDDARNDSVGLNSDIYGTRITQAGAVLDTSGILVCGAASYQRLPTIIFGDSLYLVAWYDQRNGSKIYAARLHPSGIILDTTAILVGNGYARPAVAYDGINYLVIWARGASATYDILGARITESGVVLDPNGFIISSAGGPQDSASVAFNGTYYLVVWSDGRNDQFGDIYGARVTPAGTVLDPNGIAICTADREQRNPCVIQDGSDFIVAWDDRRQGDLFDVYGVKIDSTGTIIDSFTICNEPGNQIKPVIARTVNNQYLLTFTGWLDSLNDRPANTMRIWGAINPFVSIAEANKHTAFPLSISLNVFPNPAKNEIMLNLYAPYQGKLKISLYDITGRLIELLFDEQIKAGPHTMPINIQKLSAGVYFIQAETTSQTIIRKAVILK